MDRLRQRADFLAVANGTRANSHAFIVQGRLRHDDGPVRVGFTPIPWSRSSEPWVNRLSKPTEP